VICCRARGRAAANGHTPERASRGRASGSTNRRAGLRICAGGSSARPIGAEAGAAVQAAAGDDKDEKKKKKKKKKKDQDARLRAAYVSAWGRIFAAVLSVALT